MTEAQTEECNCVAMEQPQQSGEAEEQSDDERNECEDGHSRDESKFCKNDENGKTIS